jgi:stage II sporulation protein D
MKKFALSLALLLPCFLLQGAPFQDIQPVTPRTATSSEALPSRKIKVLIAHNLPQAQLSIEGKYRIFDPHTKKHIATRLLGKNQVIQSIHDGLKWGEEFPGLHQLEFIPGDLDTTISVDGILYKGNIYVYDIGGTISIVNELPVEEFIYSVLATTPSNQQPGEVQAALAIAERTQAYYIIQNPKSTFWDIEANQTGYRGMIQDTSYPHLLRAVKNTKDMVLSLSGKFEGTVKPFAIDWDYIGNTLSKSKAMKSQVSISDAINLAKQGEHADAILKKAFPQASLHLISNE